MTGALVIGEALIDIVETDAGARELVGGSPANVAVGVARLGHRARLLTRIGRDDRGERIAAQVRSSGAVVEEESWTDAATSTARAVIQRDGSARYEFDIEWSLPVPRVHGADLVHSGSIALFLEPGGEVVLQALEAAAAASVLVSVDPNIRPALVGDHAHALTTFERAASAADIVKLSDEDAEWLYPGLAPAQVLDAIAQHGPRIVVMTRGADGAIGRGPDGIVEVPSRSVSVVDTIGAGDSYMGSLIASALEDPAAVLRR